MNQELFANATQDEEEEQNPTVPELEEFEEQGLDDIFDKLQGDK